MSFIASDEFIILMDFPEMLALDDLKRIRETGVRTLYVPLNWAQINPEPGVYNWQAPDAWIERAAAANMKALLRCYEQAPAHFPDAWYLWSADGQIWRNRSDWYGTHTMLSPWCPEAMAAEANFRRACFERYSSARVEIFSGVVHDGEVILPARPASYFDPNAVASFREYVGYRAAYPVDVATYADLAAQPDTAAWLHDSLYGHVSAQQAAWPEIWLSLVQRDTAWSEANESGPRTGNWLMREFCQCLPEQLGKELNVLLFEVFRSGGICGALDNVQGYEGQTWVGSQFCEGLNTNTEDAIARGLRGFITAPLHPDLRRGTFEPWMVEAFCGALTKWQAKR